MPLQHRGPSERRASKKVHNPVRYPAVNSTSPRALPTRAAGGRRVRRARFQGAVHDAFS